MLIREKEPNSTPSLQSNLNSVVNSGTDLSGKLGEHVHGVLEESNARIAAILNDETMSDEEKQKAIDAIDAETKERIASLMRLQVLSIRVRHASA